MQALWFFKVFNYFYIPKIVCAYSQTMEEAAEKIEKLSEYPILYWEFLGNSLAIELNPILLSQVHDAELIGGVPLVHIHDCVSQK